MYTIKVSTRKNKKYDVYKDNEYLLSFGDKRYQQYRDSTPLKAYSNLDHMDKERKRRYFLRHGLSNDPNSAKFWSNHFLWN